MMNLSRQCLWLVAVSCYSLLFCQSLAATTTATAIDQQSLQQLTQPLIGAKLRKMPAMIERLEQEVGVASLPLMEALLASELFYIKADRRLVRAVKTDTGDYQINDVLNTEALGMTAKKNLRKVKLNNSVRVQLRAAIGRLTLLGEDPNLRLIAVQDMLKKPDAANLVLLQQARAQESEADIIELLDIALALNSLVTETGRDARLQALRALDGSLQPAVRNALEQILAVDADGVPLDPDLVVRTSVRRALDGIESKLKFFGFLETLFFGLSLGSVLLLIAIGLAITFGVMGVINMAHGELIMLGAYTTYVVQLLMPNHIEYSLLVAVPAAFMVSGLVGILIERSVIRFLHGRPLETLLATFGVSLILQQAVRSVFSPLNRQVSSPEWMSGSLEINSIFSLTYNRLYVFIFALVVFAVLQLILKRTTLGLNVRAVSQNRSMAKAMGVRTDWVDAMTFGLGSGVAGIAGVALSQLTNVGPNLGQAYIIDSFMVVVFGGVGNLWGTLVGGLTLGIFSKFLEPVTGAVVAKIVVLVFIVLFIQKRPRGLFPQQGRAAE